MATATVREAAGRVCDALRLDRRLRVLGGDGALRGQLCAHAAAAASSETPVVCVAADDASARTVAIDAAFFLGTRVDDVAAGSGPIMVVPEVETSPYADVSPDPRAVGARLGALSRIGQPDGPRLIVFGLRSLMRRTLPASAMARLRRAWATDDDLDPREAIEHLVRCGYGRVDVVEDPGTFAVRGGVLDVWVPRDRFPARLEWFGDEIERIRSFDPQSQRSLRQLDRCVVHPVRETISTSAEPLRNRVLALADRVNAPSSKSRQVIDNLQQGLDFFGIDAIAPVFHDEMDPVWAYLPAGARWIVEEPQSLASLAARIEEELSQQHALAVADHQLVASPDELMVGSTQTDDKLD